MATVFVEYMEGYGCSAEIFKEKEKRLRSAGFLPATVWVLSSEMIATGECKGMNAEEIQSWLMQKIRPGRISIAEHSMGLSID